MEVTVAKYRYRTADGVIGGIIAGIVMEIVAMLGTLIMGKGIMQPIVLMGHAFQPFAEVPETSGAILFKGIAVHMVMSIIAGLIFVSFANFLFTTRNSLWLRGALYASVIWLMDQFGILISLDPSLAILMNQGVFLVAHIAYGATLGQYVHWRANKLA